MEDTSGFYCYGSNGMMHAPNFVDAPAFSLSRSEPADRTRTESGWSWFDTAADAYLAIGSELSPIS